MRLTVTQGANDNVSTLLELSKTVNVIRERWKGKLPYNLNLLDLVWPGELGQGDHRRIGTDSELLQFSGN